jgi:DNA-binding XRE family transcriptional regulator
MRSELPDAVLAAEAKSVLADPVEGELVPFDVSRYISNPVKAARIKAELSQEDLASRMGVSQAYASKLEKARKVSPKVLHQVGLALAKPKRPRRVLRKTGITG